MTDDDELPHFAAPPDPDALVAALDALTSKWGDVADELKELTGVYRRDRRFRRWVTGALVTMTIAGLVVAGVAISTALRLQEQVERPDRQAQERREADLLAACLRGNAFRQDIYSGVDSVLDTISPAATAEGREVLAKAKAEYRKKIPLRDCG